jgi:hypothetical protein
MDGLTTGITIYKNEQIIEHTSAALIVKKLLIDLCTIFIWFLRLFGSSLEKKCVLDLGFLLHFLINIIDILW